MNIKLDENLGSLRVVAETLILGLESPEVEGKLWIIQSGRIQEYPPINPEDIDACDRAQR